jgi:hydrogenase/urease accessory protein HupE
MKRVLILLVLAGVLLDTAYAHESRPAYLELRQTNTDTYDVLWKVPARGPEKRLALDVRFPADVQIIDPSRRVFVGGAFVERLSIRRTGGLTGAEISIDGLPTTLTDTLVRIERTDGSTQIARLTPSDPSFVVETTPRRVEVATTYLRFGIEHILLGIDHLLFVACLMMIAGIGMKLLITITGFTVAHSVTLALSALEWVHVPVPPVEAVIALSIVFVASEIAKGPRETLTYRHPIAVSSTFGLLHGLGFAAVLMEIGLPQAEVITGLLFFNIGVEAGQLLFVCANLALLFVAYQVIPILKQDPSHLLRLQKPLVYPIGSCAAFWIFQRVGGFWG